jgi:ribulose-5-phosphate 4-epimerase/fuculose-1-phosphate aldolase
MTKKSAGPAREARQARRQGKARPARPAGDAMLREAREGLACALRWAARFGMSEGVCNHFSVALPGDGERYLINPHGIHWSQMRASDMLLVDGAGTVLAGDASLLEATAFFIHSRVHRARADARCVLHTHMPYATALTALEGGRLEPVSQNSLRFVGITAYDEDEGGYQGLALDAGEGDRMAKALTDKRVLFLANHGVIVVGPDLATAFDDLYYLERAAQVQVMAAMTGGRLKRIGDNLARETFMQMDGLRAHYAQMHFGALRRVLDREAPDYRR